MSSKSRAAEPTIEFEAVLPDGYYLANFNVLLETVSNRYTDLLSADEIEFVSHFSSLPESARRLFVRLISRKGPLFRFDRVIYEDIDDVPGTTAVLEAAGFVQRGGEFDLELGLRLLRVGELKEFFGVAGRKDEMIQRILQSHEPELIRSAINGLFDVLAPLHTRTVATFLLLFFGNAGQDLSEFVVTDLGHVRYEDYPLNRDSRPFVSRSAVDAMLIFHESSRQFYELAEQHDVTGLTQLADQVTEATYPVELRHRHDRLVNMIARQFERENQVDAAYGLFSTTTDPPSRERRARIDLAAGRLIPSANLVNEIAADPLSEEEREFAESFGSRQFRKHGPPFAEIARSDYAPPSHRIAIVQDTELSVEEMAQLAAEAHGGKAWWCENALMNGLFGLAFWDIIFAPVAGAFHNQFQRGPADLFRSEFRKNRATEIARRLAELEKGAYSPDRIVDTYHRKEGRANWLVDWRRLPVDLVATSLERIPIRHLTGIFGRFCTDISANRSGFPDLVVFPESGSMGEYELVEVKGPGDQLQKNQLRWMRVFASIGVPHSILWVDWEGPA